MEDFRELMKPVDYVGYAGQGPFYSRVVAGRFTVSVQASRFAYCAPREDLPIGLYTKMEVAIFEKAEWVIPPQDTRLKNFDWACLFEDDPHTSVAGYVPVEVVQRICNDLEALP